MKSKTFRQFAGAIALLAFTAMVLAPAPAEAKWRDESGDLPGTDSHVGTYVAVGVGVLAVFGIIALIKHSGKDGEPVSDEDPATAPADTTGQTGATVPGGESEDQEISSEISSTSAPRLDLYLGTLPARELGANQRISAISDLGVKVGISLSF